MDIIKKISSPANQPATGEITVKMTAITNNGFKFVERFNVMPADIAEATAEFAELMECEHETSIATVQISMSFEKLFDAVYGE